MLTIGDPAPPLKIEHWIQDDDGRLEPVTAFEPGTVYVVEFWATWCGPCILSMPHLAETQAAHDPEQLRLVSISNEPKETVETFLKRLVPGDPEMTYEDLTGGYSLTTDPDESVYGDYMKAAGKSGIPTAFIIGKDSRIEWIGHPMEMDDPIQQVLEDRWDRETHAAEVRLEQSVVATMRQVEQMMEADSFDAQSDADQEEVLNLLREKRDALKGNVSPIASQLTMAYFRLLAKFRRYEDLNQAISDSLREAGTDLMKLQVASMAIPLVPDADAERRDALVDLAVQKLQNAEVPEAFRKMVADENLLQMQINMLVARLYGQTGRPKEAIKVLEATKSMTDESDFKSMIDQNIMQIRLLDSESKDSAKQRRLEAHPEAAPKPHETNSTQAEAEIATPET